MTISNLLLQCLLTAVVLHSQPILIAAQLGYRLTGGSTQLEGTVEVFRNGQWQTVCDDGWGLTEGNLVCRLLGYGPAIRVYSGAHFGEGAGNIWVRDWECTGRESSLEECPSGFIIFCLDGEAAGVSCNPPITIPTPTMGTTSATSDTTTVVTFTSSTTQPTSGTTQSTSGTTQPTQGTPQPTQGTTQPTQGTTQRTEGTAQLTQGTTPPTSGTTQPTQGTTQPTSGTTPPTSGTTVPTSTTTTTPSTSTISSNRATSSSDASSDAPAIPVFVWYIVGAIVGSLCLCCWVCGMCAACCSKAKSFGRHF